MKRVYHILALMALIFTFAAAGLAGFMFATGRLNAERIDQMALVLRGEFPKPAVAASQPASQPAPPPQPSRAEIARIQAQKEYYELITERARRELEQRRALNQQIQLDVTRQLEEMESGRKSAEQQKQATAQQANLGGFEKELEWFGSIDPKKAKELLIQRKDADAVAILVRLDSIKIKKIVDSCKSAEEMAWIGRILNQIHNMDSVSAAGVDGPAAASK